MAEESGERMTILRQGYGLASDASLECACLHLVVGQAHRVEERVPSGVISKIREERISTQTGQTRVALPARTLQPFESVILVAAIGVSLGNLIRSCLAIFCG